MMMGVGFKILSNIINTHMANRHEELKANTLQDAAIIKAHIELAKEANKDLLGKISRFIIFFMLVSCWCFIGIYGIMHPLDEMDIVVPVSKGLFHLFDKPEFTVITISGSTLLWQWFQIMEMVIGFFVIPSKRR